MREIDKVGTEAQQRVIDRWTSVAGGAGDQWLT
jgi:hypothetical protein